MFFSNLKIAIRNIFKLKFFSLINITGLAIGMTVCLLMAMYIVNEMSYESFHKKKDNIYRITLIWGTEGSKMKFAGVMPALAPALQENVPEVDHAVRIRNDNSALLTNKDHEKIREENLFFADPEIFDIFSFHLLHGNKSTALVEPYSLVLTESQAMKYFGKLNPVGESILYGDTPLKITGVIKDIPGNTHLKCEFLISYSTLKSLGKESEQPWNSWGDDLTYILLKENAKPSSLVAKITDLVSQNAGEWLTSRMKFDIQPLSKIHWDRETRGDIGPKGNILYIYIFLSAAIFVLIIACFNFMNLSTSRYLDRMKEVGIRKVIGAKRNQLVKQFLLESFLITLLAILIGAALFELLHTTLYDYLNTKFVLGAFHFKYLYGMLSGMILCVGLLAGAYPALFLSKFKPIEAMRNKEIVTEKLSFRQILVVAQFAISIILILGTLTIFRQLNFMKNSDLGFDKREVQLITFPYGDEEVRQKYTVFRDELLRNANIVSVSGAYTVPGIRSQFNMGIRKVSDTPENAITIQALPVDFGFVPTLGLQIVAGRDFSENFATDRNESVILNESAVKVLDLKNPIGEKLKIPAGNNQLKEVSVIGVVKDFHLKSLHNKINPNLMYIKPDMYLLAAVRIKPETEAAAGAFIQETWNRIFPDKEFHSRSLAEAYDSLYNSEAKTGKMLLIFTALALLVSCLGILGLASFMANKRIKEIGIRKVLGATTGSITILLSKQFSKWVVISNIFAWPIGYLLMKKWLQNFAYQTNISVLLFLLAAGIALVIALITIGTQTVKTAMANPVKALKYE